ncbi:MAG: threonine synthase [Nitrososphaerales archaeon]
MGNSRITAPSALLYARCSRCGEEYSPDVAESLCEKCKGVILMHYDYRQIAEEVSKESLARRIPSVWKYSELLPIQEKSSIVSLGEGGTHVHECRRLMEQLRVKRILVKDETTNPTASFVDRGSTVVVSKAIESGSSSVCCGATGNLGASLSAYAAKAGLESMIFLPKMLDLGKLYQMIVCGAKVELTSDYVAATVRAERFSRHSFLVTPYNPYFMEGEKTTGYEIVEQMGWRLPDRIIVPMGNGGHISMIWKALTEFSELGFIDKVNTRLTGIQAAGAAPIVDAYARGDDVVVDAGKVETLALDIGIESPSAGDLALNAIRSSGGTCATVTDREILEAARLLAKSEGIFAEPAAASTIAGLKKMMEAGSIDRDEEVLCVITGAGLKDPVTARRFVKKVRAVETVIRRVEDRRLTTRLGPTKLRILEIVSAQEAYGYQIKKELEEQFQISVKVPVVYQHLKELETLNLVRRSSVREVGGKPERHYYTLTEKGRATAKSLGTYRG